MLQLVQIHRDGVGRESIREQCCQLLNYEWPRSRALRWRMIESSRDDLPLSLALIQHFENQLPCVLGHVRLSRIPSDSSAVWLESVVVHPDLRGKGWGKHMMLLAESFCKSHLKFSTAYLSTIDQQLFYARCGYVPCEPICAYSGNVKLPSSLLNTSSNDKMDLKNSILQGKRPAKDVKESADSDSSSLDKKDPAKPPPPPPPLPQGTSLASNSLTSEEDTMKLECQKFYQRPELKEMPLLGTTLRSLLRNPDEDLRKPTKDQICRAVAPKTFMKKDL